MLHAAAQRLASHRGARLLACWRPASRRYRLHVICPQLSVEQGALLL